VDISFDFEQGGLIAGDTVRAPRVVCVECGQRLEPGQSAIVIFKTPRSDPPASGETFSTSVVHKGPCDDQRRGRIESGPGAATTSYMNLDEFLVHVAHNAGIDLAATTARLAGD